MREYKILLSISGYKYLINEPTRITNSSKTFIDFNFIRLKLKIWKLIHHFSKLE